MATIGAIGVDPLKKQDPNQQNQNQAQATNNSEGGVFGASEATIKSRGKNYKATWGDNGAALKNLDEKARSAIVNSVMSGGKDAAYAGGVGKGMKQVVEDLNKAGVQAKLIEFTKSDGVHQQYGIEITDSAGKKAKIWDAGGNGILEKDELGLDGNLANFAKDVGALADGKTAALPQANEAKATDTAKTDNNVAQQDNKAANNVAANNNTANVANTNQQVPNVFQQNTTNATDNTKADKVEEDKTLLEQIKNILRLQGCPENQLEAEAKRLLPSYQLAA